MKYTLFRWQNLYSDNGDEVSGWWSFRKTQIKSQFSIYFKSNRTCKNVIHHMTTQMFFVPSKSRETSSFLMAFLFSKEIKHWKEIKKNFILVQTPSIIFRAKLLYLTGWWTIMVNVIYFIDRMCVYLHWFHFTFHYMKFVILCYRYTYSR